MKKCKFIIIMLLVVLFQVSRPTVIHASGIADIDEFSKLDGDGKYLDSSYYENYYLDIEKTGFLDSFDKAWNSVANTLFSAVKIIGKLTCSLFYFVMDFDITDIFGDKVNAIQKAMKKSIFMPLFNLAFAGTAFILIKRLIKRDIAGILAEIGKVVAIVMLSILVVNKSDVMLSNTTKLTKSISTDVLVNMNDTYEINGKSGANYAASSAGVLWVSLVHEPWKSLEFGTANPDKEMMQKFLSTDPDSDERKELVKKYKDKGMFDKSAGGNRIALIIVYFIPFIIKCMIYIFVAAIQLVFQVLALLFVMLAPLVLILAMLPDNEGMIHSWLKKILETQISILVITFMMALMIKIDTSFYDMIPKYGWLVGISLQTIFSLGLFLGRNKILAVFSNMQRGHYLQMQMRHAGNPYRQIQQGQNTVKQLKMNYANFVKQNDDKVHFVRNRQGSSPNMKQGKARNRPESSDVHSRKQTTHNIYSYPEVDYCATKTQYNQIDTNDIHTIWENAVPKERLSYNEESKEVEQEGAGEGGKNQFLHNKAHEKKAGRSRPVTYNEQKRQKKSDQYDTNIGSVKRKSVAVIAADLKDAFEQVEHTSKRPESVNTDASSANGVASGNEAQSSKGAVSQKRPESVNAGASSANGVAPGNKAQSSKGAVGQKRPESVNTDASSANGVASGNEAQSSKGAVSQKRPESVNAGASSANGVAPGNKAQSSKGAVSQKGPESVNADASSASSVALGNSFYSKEEQSRPILLNGIPLESDNSRQEKKNMKIKLGDKKATHKSDKKLANAKTSLIKAKQKSKK